MLCIVSAWKGVVVLCTCVHTFLYMYNVLDVLSVCLGALCVLMAECECGGLPAGESWVKGLEPRSVHVLLWFQV